MRCQACGRYNEDDAAQCAFCGTDLQPEAPPPDAPAGDQGPPLQLPPRDRLEPSAQAVLPFYPPPPAVPGAAERRKAGPGAIYITVGTGALLLAAVVALAIAAVRLGRPQAAMRRGDQLYGQGRLTEAAEEYAKAVKARPDDAECRERLAGTLMRLNRDAEAVAHFEAAVKLQPERAEWWVELGTARYKCGDLRGSIQADRKAAELSPQNWAAHDNLAFSLYDLDQVDEAVQHWERAATLSGGDADCEAGLAIGYLAQGKTAEAKTHYQRAVRADSNYFDTEYMRREALWSDKALEAAEQLMPLVDEPEAQPPPAHEAPRRSARVDPPRVE